MARQPSEDLTRETAAPPVRSDDAAAKEGSDQLVVIGASAGGIEALGLLLASLPAAFPAPIVIAQHLDPTRTSHLPEILGRRSTLPVRVVGERERLGPGVVHLVPADRHVEIVDDAVQLADPPA